MKFQKYRWFDSCWQAVFALVIWHILLIAYFMNARCPCLVQFSVYHLLNILITILAREIL